MKPGPEITLTRIVRTSPARLYGAFTRVEGWCAWCCERAEADARVGGKLHIYTDGYNAYGEFAVLEPERTVAFTWDGDKEPPTRIHVSLSEQEGGTLVTFQVAVLAAGQGGEGFIEFLESTWGRALDNLKAVLEAEPAGG
jgi:uncharacterized protein YndB with AHSA1/START domain